MSAAGARHSGSNRRVEYLGLNCAAAREAMRKWMKKVDTSERAAPAWAHSGVRFRAQATLMRAANRKRYGGGDVISPHKPSQAPSSNSAKRAASLCLFAGEGGFEPPEPQELMRAEFGPSLARYSARIKASVLERIYSPWIRTFFGSLRFPSFAKLTRGI